MPCRESAKILPHPLHTYIAVPPQLTLLGAVRVWRRVLLRTFPTRGIQTYSTIETQSRQVFRGDGWCGPSHSLLQNCRVPVPVPVLTLVSYCRSAFPQGEIRAHKQAFSSVVCTYLNPHVCRLQTSPSVFCVAVPTLTPRASTPTQTTHLHYVLGKKSLFFYSSLCCVAHPFMPCAVKSLFNRLASFER